MRGVLREVRWMVDPALLRTWGWRHITWYWPVVVARANMELGLWAGRRCPRWLRYWVTIDTLAQCTSGAWSSTDVPEMTADTLLRRTAEITRQ